MNVKTYVAHVNAGYAYGREATCVLKQRHATEEAATKAAESLNRSGRARHENEAYPCAWCRLWHIGRKMTEDELARFTPRKDET